MPPRVSAIKKDGVRLYELARANQVSSTCMTTDHPIRMQSHLSNDTIPPIYLQQIDVQARRVHIHNIDLRQFTPGPFPEVRQQ